MIGGLVKSSSRLALLASMGLLVGGVAMPSAKAADLGGDCCADLEERVAELEATTARKGNRKMSLTISGQVHRVVVWYDDGKSSTTYYGLDNTNSSTRFVFNGSAKITPKVTTGFEIMIEIEAGGTSSKVNQFDEDGKVGGQISGSAAPATSFNASNVDAYFGDARRAAWWMEHADLGRITVGRWESAGVLGTIDITGQIFLPASGSFTLLNGGFFLRGPTGQYYAMQWSNIVDTASNNPGRTELVRYDSASWHGFIYSASIAEAGDYYGTMLRYAGEFSGFRLAGTVGYEKIKDRSTPTTIDPTVAAFTGPTPDQSVWGFALSAMHVPTGLFVQGHYNHVDYNAPFNVNSGYWGSTGGATQKPSDQWLIQAGIQKNWFGYGNTSVYGEYGKADDWGGSDAGRNFAGTTATSGCPGPNSVCSPTIQNFTTVNGVTGTEVTVWGLGVVQGFSAAATDLYAGYRHMDADIHCNAGANCAGAVGSGNATLSTKGIDVIVMGARVLF
jgi:hypothetical protein